MMLPTGDAKGRRAESLAALYLTLKGYRILARRARTSLGEIDLVAARGEILAFVEVKYRPDADTAAESVRVRQQRRISGAARAFLARHPKFNEKTIRFDLVMMAPWRWPKHILNAWPGSGHNAG
jgi:putative endonuclease